jgi:beta-N-acetylhexosaminidase
MIRRRNVLADLPYQEWLSEYKALLDEVRDAIGRESIIVCVDHEGGRVNRYPAPITRFPYPAFYGSSLSAVEAVSKAMAIELKSLGVNISFSPVADIHSNPLNPVINQRAYGCTPEAASAGAATCARTLRAHGVMPCAKHFPGHGDTQTDSHTALPLLNLSIEQLIQRELIPFEALISEGIEAIMSAHILLPQIDALNPATLSPIIMRDLLRSRMGFKGVSIADALGMQAIHGELSADSFAARAHSAGIDLLLVVGDPVQIADAVRMRDSLAESVKREEVLEGSLQAVQERLESLLTVLPHYTVEALSDSQLSRHAALADDLSKQAEWAEFHFEPEGFE